MTKPLAIVTGASTGIGLELARLCADDGYDLIIAADTDLDAATADLRARGAEVDAIMTDLGTPEGVAELVAAIEGRDVHALLANAGHGLGGAFLDQNLGDVQAVIDVNISGTIALIHTVANTMRARNSGKILITGSIAGFIPGSFHAVYNGSKAFVDSFSWALRNELKGTEVTVTCLMPGATETEFFERADMGDTQVGQSDKADAAKVAKDGYDAMNKGEAGVVSGIMNKVQVAIARMVPNATMAEAHRKTAEPAGGNQG